MILKDDDGSVESVKVGPGHVAANTIRLFIATTQVGGLIRVSGQNVENLRNNSGASVGILAPNQLPPCVSTHESDRVVQISGDIPAVDIGCQLRENPPKQVIGISPSYNAGFHWQSQQYVDPTSAEYVTLELMVPENLVGGLIGRFGANISRIRNESGANIKVYGSRGEQTQRQIHLGGSAQQVYVTSVQLMVPENLVGGLIGRFGANISRIRNESGANIKVYGSRGEQTQRQIHLGGSAQQVYVTSVLFARYIFWILGCQYKRRKKVALAKQWVDEYVYAELLRQAGGQHHQTAGQLQQVASHQPISDLANMYYQSYGYAHGFYTHSNQDAEMMAAVSLSLHCTQLPQIKLHTIVINLNSRLKFIFTQFSFSLPG